MKKKRNQLRLNKKQVSTLNQSVVTGGRRGPSNQCPIETIQITRCYGANQCQKWPD
ncbi:hypothetical protein [Kordia sp.]|uniref:hypothetical protein n=1 Tax=Kordia sp. TaxID=1965332 RepID=UPI003D6ADBC3